jgi:hypothetical protein
MATENLAPQFWTPETRFALADVYGSALAMVRALATTSSRLARPAVKNFQISWNDNRAVLRAFAGTDVPWDGALAVLVNGLSTDGGYGSNTAVALALVIYLSGADEDHAAVSAVPTSAAGVAPWVGQFGSVIEAALLTDFSTWSAVVQDTPPPDDVVVDPPSSDTTLTVEPPPSDMGSDFTYEGDTIVSSGKRKGWDVPIWAVGLGLLTAGGLFYFIVKRKRRAV